MLRSTLLVAGVALGACTSQQKLATLDGQGMESAAEKNVTVEVVSRQFLDCTLYLDLGTSRQRLGKATGMATTVFGVPWNAEAVNAVEARLVAETLGKGQEGTLVSSPFRMSEGGRVVWTIQGHQNRPPSEVSLGLY